MKKFIFCVFLAGFLIVQHGIRVDCSVMAEDIIDDDEEVATIQSEDEANFHATKPADDTNRDLDPEEDVKAVVTSSPDAETFTLFTEPTTVKDLVAGKLVKFLVSFYNKGDKEFLVERLDYTDAIFNRPVLPDTEATFDYSFIPSDAYIGRPLGLSIILHYSDDNKTQLFNSVFNETVNIVEDESGFNPETGFLYIVFGCLSVLLLVLGQQFLSKMRKRHGMTKRSAGMEMGTTKNGDIDYDWIPKELLQKKNILSKKEVRNNQIRKDQ